MDPRLAAIESRYGVFLRREILELGHTDRDITRLVSCGEWHRVRSGAFVAGTTWRAASDATRFRLFSFAALRKAQTEVAASHASAVALHGGPLWGIDRSVAHLTRLDGRTGRKERGIQQHRGTLVEGDLVTAGPFQITHPTRTALELTTVATVDASLCVVNDFLHRRLTTKDALEERYATMTQWPNTLPTDIVLRLCDPRMESVGETRTDLLCYRQGLPRPVPQLEVYDENEVLIGRVDFAWPDLGVFLEFDGREKYLKYRRRGESMEDAILREKRREDEIRRVTGWRCIRITWADLQHPEILAAKIRNVLYPHGQVA